MHTPSSGTVEPGIGAEKIILATLGTMGDLHPFIGIALALRQAGFQPVIATHEEYRSVVDSTGLAFHRLRPDREQLEESSPGGLPQLLRAARRRPQLILTRYVLPYLEQSYDDAGAAMAGARLVFTSSLSFGARLAAEAHGVPHVAVILQPAMMASAYDPPVLSAHTCLGRLLKTGGPAVNRALLGFARWISRGWTRPVDRLRARLGLAREPHPLFEGQWTGSGALGLYSSVLGGPQPDHPSQFKIAGFSFYDGDGELPQDLMRFLDEGTAPLIFTLGTSAVHDCHRFMQVALQALTVMRERAVVILDDLQCEQWRPKLPAQVRIVGYVPYSKIFPRARIIVHHGGIGTTAQALRAARPQLIAPYFVDQPDNAARVARCGVGHVLPLERWTSRRLVSALTSLMNDPAIVARAKRVASDMAKESGGSAAVELAIRILRSPTQFTVSPVPTPLLPP